MTSKDISVVVQGPIHHQNNLTRRALESVREHLPDAELILSTWKGSDVSGLDYDILVENEDPGAFETGYSIDNVNRQIVSTLNGIKASRGNYVLKIRTDSALTGNGFLSFYNQFPIRIPKYKLFDERVVTLTLFSRNPALYARLFHPSDIAQFGKKSDLLLLWNVPLLCPNVKEFYEYVPESYIFLQSLKAKSMISDTYRCMKLSIRALYLSEVFLTNNFVFLSPSQFGIHLSRHLFSEIRCPERNYSFKDWLKMYNHYCVKKGRMPKVFSIVGSYYVWFIKFLGNRGIGTENLRKMYDALLSKKLTGNFAEFSV